MNDSDLESITSNNTSEDESFYNSDNLSIVEEFDELMQFLKTNDDIETKLLEVVKQIKDLNNNLCRSQDECRRLRQELDKRIQDCSDFESKLTYARKLLDQERKRCSKLEADLLMKSKNEKTSLDVTNNPKINDSNQSKMTSSLLSNLGCSFSEDDLDVSFLPSETWNRHTPSMGLSKKVALEKRLSADSKIVKINSNYNTGKATTSLIPEKGRATTITSAIETVPLESYPPSSTPLKNMNFYPSFSSRDFSTLKQHQHTFQTRTTVLPEICNVCKKKIGFAKVIFKCKDCRNLCHTECKHYLPLPCIPSIQKPVPRSTADFVPSNSPIMPPLIVHCIKEIEARGLNKVGIYRIPESEREVKALKERFLNGKDTLCLSNVNVNVLCGTVKFFLRSLSEPIITYARWPDFNKAVKIKKKIDMVTILYQIISELPKSNQDTLAYVILHLKRVAESPECKMPIESLAKIFGPTIIGYSSPDASFLSLMDETTKQFAIMKNLLKLPNDYWESVINFHRPEK